MSTKRTGTMEQRKLTRMRQASAETSRYTISGREKEGVRAVRKPSMPKMPWDDEGAADD